MRLWYPLSFIAGWRDVELAPRDWLYPRIVAGLVELHDAKHVAVVCYGKGLHAKLLGFSNVFGTRSGSVKQRIVRMVMEVYEFRHLNSLRLPVSFLFNPCFIFSFVFSFTVRKPHIPI